VWTGLLYRSTDLSQLDGDDAEAFGGLGVRTVHDLRTESECAAQPDRLPPGTALVAADVPADAPEATPAQITDVLSDPEQAAAAFGNGRGAAILVGKYRDFARLGRQASPRSIGRPERPRSIGRPRRRLWSGGPLQGDARPQESPSTQAHAGV